MKLTKLAFMSVATVLALWGTSTKASIGVTTNYSKLNISVIVTTNSQQVIDDGTSWEYPVKSIRFGNKQLLNWFAGWAGADRTGEPWKSAQLVIGWDWDGDVLVVDKTGTNILYDAIGDYYEETTTHYFYVNFRSEPGACNSSGSRKDHIEAVETGTAYFELYDDGYYLPYTDLSGYGGNKQNFKQSWDANGTYTTWSDSESAKFLYNGGQAFLCGGSIINYATTTAKISAIGKGKGSNLGLY